MVVEKQVYHLAPSPLMPNSPYPLIHYKNLLPTPESRKLSSINALYARNGWQTQWIFRYGPTQRAHYHSAAHECMTVLSGKATIRFGAGDTTDDMDANTHGTGYETDFAIELQAAAGDLFIIPAGVSHKTYDTYDADGKPSEFKLLTPGGGHGIDAGESGDVGAALDAVELSGYTMMGAYPTGGVWDFAEGGEHKGMERQVWNVERPRWDPVLGDSEEGLSGVWKSRRAARL